MRQPSLLQVLLNPRKLRGLGSSLGPAIGSGVEQALAVGTLQNAGAALGLSSPGSGLNVFSCVCCERMCRYLLNHSVLVEVRDQTWAIRLCSEHRYLLSHLASPPQLRFIY